MVGLFLWLKNNLVVTNLFFFSAVPRILISLADFYSKWAGHTPLFMEVQLSTVSPAEFTGLGSVSAQWLAK